MKFIVLAPDGVFIYVSCGNSEHRKKHLQKQPWAKYSCEKIIKPDTSNNPPHEDDSNKYHFIYIMNKGKFI